MKIRNQDSGKKVESSLVSLLFPREGKKGEKGRKKLRMTLQSVKHQTVPARSAQTTLTVTEIRVIALRLDVKVK